MWVKQWRRYKCIKKKEKCIKRHVVTVEKSVKSRSSQAAIGLCIVGNVIKSTDPHEEDSNTLVLLYI